jgi:hypothetical protein
MMMLKLLITALSIMIAASTQAAQVVQEEYFT